LEYDSPYALVHITAQFSTIRLLLPYGVYRYNEASQYKKSARAQYQLARDTFEVSFREFQYTAVAELTFTP